MTLTPNDYQRGFNDGYAAHKQEPSWVSVEDGEPKSGEYVLVWGTHSVPWLAEYLWSRFVSATDRHEYNNVTHWMSLPGVPE